MQHFADNPGQAKHERHGERWQGNAIKHFEKPVAAHGTDNDAEKKGRQGNIGDQRRNQLAGRGGKPAHPRQRKTEGHHNQKACHAAKGIQKYHAFHVTLFFLAGKCVRDSNFACNVDYNKDTIFPVRVKNANSANCKDDDMSNTVVIGAQWGDEGKGKIVDLLSAQSQVIVRFQGGANAGHTIKTAQGETILHLVPSGILFPDTLCIIGNGVVLDADVFLQEIDDLAQKGIDISPKRLCISKKTHLVLPYHKALDKAREARRALNKIGTTGRGIGPAYEDKAARTGIRACDLADPKLLESKIKHALIEKNALLQGLYHYDPINADEIVRSLLSIAPRLLPYIQDTDEMVHSAIDADKNILFEGAQGIHLDIDHGTYPFVTSSNTVAGGACAGCGIAPSDIDRIIGVVKAYSTRVGSGPFPTELLDDAGTYLRASGHEFGATTGRPRRCGWFDAVILRESCRLNGLTGIALTKLDVLQNLPVLKVCVAYMLDGKKLEYPPQEEGALAKVTPVYEEFAGFEDSIEKCRKFGGLPKEAQNYVRALEELAGTPITMISVGPDRDQTIFRQN